MKIDINLHMGAIGNMHKGIDSSRRNVKVGKIQSLVLFGLVTTLFGKVRRKIL